MQAVDVDSAIYVAKGVVDDLMQILRAKATTLVGVPYVVVEP